MLTLTDLVFMHSIHILVITTLYSFFALALAEPHKWKKCLHDAPLKNARDKKKKKKERKRDVVLTNKSIEQWA